MGINVVHLEYKKETGLSACDEVHDARVGRWGAVIIDDPGELADQVIRTGEVVMLNDEYVAWLENIAINYLNLK